MSKRRQQHGSRPRARVRADGTVAGAPRPRPAGQAASPSAAATPQGGEAQPVPAGTRPDFGRIFADPGFRRSLWLLNAGLIALLLSQGITHEYGFLELGFLFTLSVYDLVLAMLGLSLGVAMAATRRDFAAIVGVFLGVLLVMLTFFDPIFRVIFDSPLADYLFLVAPSAVMATGASLWLTGPWRQRALIVAAALVAFSFSLFVGLDDLGIGILDFTAGTVLCALWLVLAPALALRHFRGPWLKIPSRIVGSWLVVIGIIVLASLYVPMPLKAPSLPDPSQPDGGAIELNIPDDGSAPTLNGETLDLGDDPALLEDLAPEGPDTDLPMLDAPDDAPDAAQGDAPAQGAPQVEPRP